MSDSQLSLLFGGDFSVGKDSATYLEGVNDLLDSADVRMFQLEEPYTKELLESAGPYKVTSVLDPIIGKVDLVTLSGNHFYDYGEIGVHDTIEWCHDNGIVCVGGGSTAEEARQPGFFEKDGVRIGVLAWNVIGSKYTFATPNRGGTNGLQFTRAWVPESQLDQTTKQLRIEFDTHSLKEPVEFSEKFWGHNYLEPSALLQMADDIRAAKAQCDVLIAYYHMGYVHQPVIVNDWERLIAHMAIDAGADAVTASHSHVAHGVEVYRDAPIFYGLNNFVMWVPQLSPNFKGKIPGDKDSGNEEWIKARVKRFGFVPDPEYPTYPFHPESVYCPVAKFIIEKDADGAHIAQTRMVLMKTEKSGIPYVHGQDEAGRETLNYMQSITQKAGLNAVFDWDGDEVIVHD